MKNPLVPLWIMCFVVQRCKQINDNLIDTFHSLVSKYKQRAKELAEGSQENSRESFENNEKKLARVLDLFVNILTNHAFHNRQIKVYGGDQLRPNIHIDDMVRSYISVLNANPKKINGEIFNVGYKNQTVNELADNVKEVIGEDVKIIKTSSDDNRSYHVSCEKIKNILGFETKFTIKDAVQDLKNSFEKKILQNTFENEMFFNIKRMNNINLK